MLDKIIAHKQQELDKTRSKTPWSTLSERIPEKTPPDLRSALGPDSINIIAEIKYRSPSHGPFRNQWPLEKVAQTYCDNGAAALSVLTDTEFFGGRNEYVSELRKTFPEMPTLRKDFILDRYQVLETLVSGASGCLLIAACLPPDNLAELREYSLEIGLQPLVEVHDQRELEIAVEVGARFIGVNNRDLNTFQVDLNTSFRLARQLEGESGYTLVSESGIREHLQIQELRDAGYDAFLVGSTLMDSADPGSELRRLRGEDG